MGSRLIEFSTFLLALLHNEGPQLRISCFVVLEHAQAQWPLWEARIVEVLLTILVVDTPVSGQSQVDLQVVLDVMQIIESPRWRRQELFPVSVRGCQYLIFLDGFKVLEEVKRLSFPVTKRIAPLIQPFLQFENRPCI